MPIILGVKCCDETLLMPPIKQQDTDWYFDVYWKFSRRHSPAGPTRLHQWKFAIEVNGKLIVEKNGKQDT